MQVMGLDNRQNTVQVVKKLIADDGWKGLYRGLGPRFFSMSAWGTSMILAYEYLSMNAYLTFPSLCCNILFLSNRFEHVSCASLQSGYVQRRTSFLRQHIC